TSLGEQRDLFGALSGQPWAVGRDWLIATSAFATSDGRPADATLQLSLDPGGGRLELWARSRADGTMGAVGTLADGRPSPPGPGQSLLRVGGVLTISPSPGPRGSNGVAYVASLACRSTTFPSAFVREFQLTCTTGSSDGRFVELEGAAFTDFFDSTVALRCYGHDGTLLGEQSNLFGALSGQAWSLGRNWLIATPVYSTVPGGRGPDTPI